MQDAEVELIMRTMVDAVQTYDQVVEVRSSRSYCASVTRPLAISTLDTLTPQQLLALTPPHNGGLLPLSFGLFHQQEVVRDLTVDLFTQLRTFSVSHHRSLLYLTLYPPPLSPPKHLTHTCV